MPSKEGRINEALGILADIGMPRAQQNERSALCLLALINLAPEKKWSEATSPLMGITPIMDWVRNHFDKVYAPNTRETFRRQTMHQFVQAGIALYNPDEPSRPVNSPRAVYQIEPTCLALLKSFGTKEYPLRLKGFLAALPGLAEKYAKHREMEMVPLRIAAGQEIVLSPGAHSELIQKIWEDFGPRFVPGGELVYAGDTGDKWGYFNQDLLKSMGISVDNHGKMPDAVIYYPEKQWLILAEAVTSHGPVDPKRHEELQMLFDKSTAGLVFVSAFPDRRTFIKYADAIAWETEVWIADNPSHLIHFNGARFLGPHPKQPQIPRGTSDHQ
jgi:hypothetical protein